MGNKNEMKKLAAYKRLCKLASVAKVVRYKRAMAKVAGEVIPPTHGYFEDIFKAGPAGSTAAMIARLKDDGMSESDIMKALKSDAIKSYSIAGAAPVGGGLLGYGIGKLLGGDKGGFGGALLGSGIGLGASPIFVAKGMGSGSAYKTLLAKAEEAKAKAKAKNKPAKSGPSKPTA